jgi:hypothetical protein
MENKDIKTVKNIFIATFIIVVAIFILHPKNIYAVASEVQPWCAVPLKEYNNPGGAVSSAIGSGAPQLGINTSSSSCNSSLYTNNGYCPLSKNLISVYSQVGSAMNMPPAYLAAEKQQESGVNCFFDSNSQGGTSITNIENIIISDPSPHYNSFGPFSFKPSTWHEYASQVAAIMQTQFPGIYQNIGINQDDFLESMIGASLLLKGDSPVSITSVSSWTTYAMEIASAKYNAGSNYQLPVVQKYVRNVQRIYNSLSKECNF